MSRYNYHQSAFKNGMISPKLLGRTDIEEYSYSVKDMKNFLPSPMGGAFSRPGSVTQLEIPENSIVIPWHRTNGSYYIIYTQQELTGFSGGPSDCPFRAYTSQWMPVTTLFSVQAITNWDVATTMGTHDDIIQHQTNGLAELESLDLYGFMYIQTEEFLILTHKSGKIPPLVFYINNASTGSIRIEHYQFSGKISVSYGGNYSQYNSATIVNNHRASPYLINKESSTYLLPSGYTQGIAGAQATTNLTGIITAYAGNTATTKDYFTSDMLYTYLVLKQGAVEGVFFIDSITSPSVANVRVMTHVTDLTTKTNQFRRQLFARDLGFPKLIYSFNGRIILANTLTKPNWFFASKTNDLKEFLGFELFQSLTEYPITEKSSFELPLNSSNSSEIKWISQQNDLLIGTNKEEFVVTQGDGVLSILNYGISSQSNIGGSFVTAIKNSESVFFVTSDGRTIRQAQYNFDVKGYRSKNISVLNDDLILKLRDTQVYESLASIKIIQIAWQESNRCLWVLTNTNNLFSITIEPSTNTVAWAYHEIGGGAPINSIFTFFSESLSRSILGIVAERTNGTYVDFVAPEYLNNSLVLNSLDIGDQAVFCDGSAIIASQDDGLSFECRDAAGPLQNTSTGESIYGLTQLINTGKKFTINSITYPNLDGPEPTLEAATHVYMINYYSGYGFPTLRYALTLADALAGAFFTTTKIVELQLEDAEPEAKYTKWGRFVPLTGETVDVIADGVLREDIVVDSDGMITLPTGASKVTVGYRFDGYLTPVTPEAGGQFGSSSGSLKRIDRAYVRYYNTRTGKIGSREGNLEPIIFPEVPFTGAKEHYVDSTADREYNIILKKEQSLPMNVMSITFRGKSDE